jgi:hypothetical protein
MSGFDNFGTESTMEPEGIWLHTHTGDSVSTMTSSLSGNTATTNSHHNTVEATFTTPTTTNHDVQTSNRDDETNETNVTTPSTHHKKSQEEADMYSSPSAHPTNIPQSPSVQRSRFRTEAEFEAFQDLGYDSDGYLPTFTNDEDEYELFEDPLDSIPIEEGPCNLIQQQQQEQLPVNAPLAIVEENLVHDMEVVEEEQQAQPGEQQQAQPHPIMPSINSFPPNDPLLANYDDLPTNTAVNPLNPTNTVPTEAAQPPALPLLTLVEVNNMKAAQLKDELRKRNVKGLSRMNKDKMCQMLSDIISNPIQITEVPTAPPPPPPAVANHPVLSGFSAGAHWVKLILESEPVMEPMNVSNFHQPTVSADDAPYLPDKYNYQERFDRLVFTGMKWVPTMKNGKVL